MPENIFENAKFGDAFKTRSGDVAYFQKTSLNEICNADKDGNPKTYLYMTAILFTELFSIECIICRVDEGCADYSANGQCCNLSAEFDIVSQWKNEQYIETTKDAARFYREVVAKTNPDLSESILNMLETAYIAGRNVLLLK